MLENLKKELEKKYEESLSKDDKDKILKLLKEVDNYIENNCSANKK